MRLRFWVGDDGLTRRQRKRYFVAWQRVHGYTPSPAELAALKAKARARVASPAPDEAQG